MATRVVGSETRRGTWPRSEGVERTGSGEGYAIQAEIEGVARGVMKKSGIKCWRIPLWLDEKYRRVSDHQHYVGSKRRSAWRRSLSLHLKAGGISVASLPMCASADS